jgi:hypothetical protein
VKFCEATGFLLDVANVVAVVPVMGGEDFLLRQRCLVLLRAGRREYDCGITAASTPDFDVDETPKVDETMSAVECDLHKR